MSYDEDYYAELAKQNRERDRLTQIELGWLKPYPPENAREYFATLNVATRERLQEEGKRRVGGGPAGSELAGCIVMLAIPTLFLLAFVGIVWTLSALRPNDAAAVRTHLRNHQNQFADAIAKDALDHENYSKAMYWYEISAKQGDVVAEYGLGVLLNERGANASTKANGLAWIRKSAKSGYPPAKQWLAQNIKGEAGRQ